MLTGDVFFINGDIPAWMVYFMEKSQPKTDDDDSGGTPTLGNPQDSGLHGISSSTHLLGCEWGLNGISWVNHPLHEGFHNCEPLRMHWLGQYVEPRVSLVALEPPASRMSVSPQ